MPLFYPSFDALRLADGLLGEIGNQTPGFEGRVGAAWYWRLPAGILAIAHLDHTVTEERWDIIRAQASTPRAGIFSTADFPFAAYATSATSPPFIHDLQGRAEWSNRLYFQMGHLIGEVAHWVGMLHAVAISPQISSPSSFPALSPLERKLVQYTLDDLGGVFTIKALHQKFSDHISRHRLSKLARAWEARELLTSRPRRVTYALRLLMEREE
ncbi:MAG: hypothetical protein DRJ03_25925 [Chloroflexi bacterium]|nr:MAG: hypothetical protein B6I35_06560 [Anaerolineaceae bacterium 4572_32.2]RLC73930.1 MAG: hypothetical protein DRI81_14545 [Chloroflexota bacterium]RLC77987.1 MAG: hypothetical protein DRJ03_25925 [Chloroflexota bacterium]HEY72134.1 hypothetical protein [Thermoflexia bacterium]